MATNEYHFVTHWRVRGTVAEVMEVISDAESLPRWWPAVYLEARQLAALSSAPSESPSWSRREEAGTIDDFCFLLDHPSNAASSSISLLSLALLFLLLAFLPLVEVALLAHEAPALLALSMNTVPLPVTKLGLSMLADFM